MVRKAVGQVSLVEALLPAAFGSNQRLERIRAQVDWRRVRYRGLIRNRCQLWLLCTAMNLRRADQITG